MDKVRIFFPAGAFGPSDADSALDWAMREIAKVFSPNPEGEWADKYGTNVDNAVFLMHPYCWCERGDCMWCSDIACGCPDPDPEYYLDGEQITDWESANNAIVAPFPWDVAKRGTKKYAAAERAFDASIVERDHRLKTIYPERIHSCKPAGLLENRHRGEQMENQNAPNFWHKSSGFKVWWYKYIAREMSTNRDLKDGELQSIFDDCMRLRKTV